MMDSCASRMLIVREAFDMIGSVQQKGSKTNVQQSV